MLQPLFMVPVYFSVLTTYPPLWLSVIIAIIPLGVRYGFTGHLFTRTPFDSAILLFMLGSVIGFIVSPNKIVATGALISTMASIGVYYGLTENNSASRKYWGSIGGIICLITLLLSLWFLSQSSRRVLSFNQWAFNLFSGFPKTSGPVLELNTIGALLAVILPTMFAFAIFERKIILRIISLLLFFFFSGMLLLSDSGAGWLATVISLAVVLVCWRRWLIFVFVPVGGIVIASVVIFYDKTTWLRTTFSTNSLMTRVVLWQNTLTLLRGRSAITGLGLGSWYQVYASHFGRPLSHVHNSYLQLYCDTGILGFIALIIGGVIFVRLSMELLKLSRRNSERWIGIGLIGSIIAGAIFSVFDVLPTITYVTTNNYIYLSIPLLWIAAASMSVLHMKNNSQVVNPNHIAVR